MSISGPSMSDPVLSGMVESFIGGIAKAPPGATAQVVDSLARLGDNLGPTAAFMTDVMSLADPQGLGVLAGMDAANLAALPPPPTMPQAAPPGREALAQSLAGLGQFASQLGGLGTESAAGFQESLGKVASMADELANLSRMSADLGQKTQAHAPGHAGGSARVQSPSIGGTGKIAVNILQNHHEAGPLSHELRLGLAARVISGENQAGLPGRAPTGDLAGPGGRSPLGGRAAASEGDIGSSFGSSLDDVQGPSGGQDPGGATASDETTGTPAYTGSEGSGTADHEIAHANQQPPSSGNAERTDGPQASRGPVDLGGAAQAYGLGGDPHIQADEAVDLAQPGGHLPGEQRLDQPRGTGGGAAQPRPADIATDPNIHIITSDH